MSSLPDETWKAHVLAVTFELREAYCSGMQGKGEQRHAQRPRAKVPRSNCTLSITRQQNDMHSKLVIVIKLNLMLCQASYCCRMVAQKGRRLAACLAVHA